MFRAIATLLAAGTLFAGSLPANATSVRPVPHLAYQSACPATPIHCNAEIVISPRPADSAPYSPQTLRTAYNLPAAAPVPQTVAIIDAGSDPTLTSDLAAYDARYGLPAANLRVVNQDGGTTLPGSQGWEVEIALDVETVHGLCPNCSILFVAANSANGNDLATAVNTAARLGATEISNSYGGGETTGLDSAYNHPGVAITASTGDNGYGVEWPASLPSVIAVGGTTLYTQAGGSYAGERAWSGAGSGCSQLESAPSWQHTPCGSMRGVADVSADADPNTGVAVMNGGTWEQVGGTSLSAPIVAATIALAGGMAGVQYPGNVIYRHAGSFHDVTSGSNGSCGTAVCNAGSGWDGPTGVGSVWGVAGFQSGSSPVPTPTSTPRPTSTPVAPTSTPVPPTATPTVPVPSPTPTQPTPPANGFHAGHFEQYRVHHGLPLIHYRNRSGSLKRVAWQWQFDHFSGSTVEHWCGGAMDGQTWRNHAYVEHFQGCTLSGNAAGALSLQLTYWWRS